MRCIVIGLGNFGSSLAEKLTKMGNEVIAVDSNMQKVEGIKEKVTHAICLDSVDPQALATLPLKNTDIVVVCIGEDAGANIMTTATLKNLNVKRLISRSLNVMHENVLQAIGVTEIVRPEEETAERWAKKLNYKDIIESFKLTADDSIVEVVVNHKFVGKTIEEIGFRNKFNLLILTIIKNKEEFSLLGKAKLVPKVQGIPNPTTRLEADDILVVYGSNKDIEKFVSLK